MMSRIPLSKSKSEVGEALGRIDSGSHESLIDAFKQ